MFPQQRRKLSSLFSPPPPPSLEMKRRGNLSILALVLSVLLFGFFMYNEDFKSIAEFPVRSSPVGVPDADVLRGSRHEMLLPSKPAAIRAGNDPVVIAGSVGDGDEHGKKEEEEEEEKSRRNKTKNRAPKNVIEEAVPAAAQHQEQERPQEDRVPLDDDVGRKIQMPASEPVEVQEEKSESISVPENCDVFDGTWVYDDVGHPLYQEDECEFLTAQVTCMRNGRKDDGYQKWRWQPRDCSLPRFDPRLFAERLRGKRLMFVGDSLNRNQWESMVCLVQSAAEPGKKSLVFDGSRRIFRLHDYNATVEFYWAPFIVQSNSDDPNIHSILDRIIEPESIDKHGVHWEGVDYLIFNTYIWWMNTYKMKVLRGSFADNSTEYDEVDRPDAYGRVIRTWADWVNRKVNPSRTSVFFSSMSPLHIKSTDWNNPDGIKCAKETEPVLNTTAPLDVGVDWRVLEVAANVTRTMGTPVYFLNITRLSEYRKDAHTSVYTIRQGHMLTPEQQADPATYADCIHWCLPGLPDTWNEFLYARIMSSKTPEGHA